MREFAERLITYEARGKPSAITNPAAFEVCDKLRPHLATLMGTAGFRALLSRALTVAGGQIPWLRGLQVRTDGTLDGLGALHAQLAPEEIHEGRIVLLAQLLGLLVAFIGNDLTINLVHDVWPQLPLDYLESGKGDKK